LIALEEVKMVDSSSTLLYSAYFQFYFHIKKCSFWLNDRGNQDIGRSFSFLALAIIDTVFLCNKLEDAKFY